MKLNDKTTILVIGGSGQIGNLLVRQLQNTNVSVTGTYLQNPFQNGIQLDASDLKQVTQVFNELKPSVVINAFNAPGGADACQIDPELANTSHYESAKNIIDCANFHRTKVIQLSTDYVFDGESGPYSESDKPNPISHLGKAKLKVEQYLGNFSKNSLIIRTSFVFSWTPESKTKNFVMQLLDCHNKNQTIPVPIDQTGNITYAPNLVDAIQELISLQATGLYHLSGLTRCSKYDWALKVIDSFNLNPSIVQGLTTHELDQAAPRPLESGFKLDKAQSTLNNTTLYTLDEALSHMKTIINKAS